MIDNTIDEHTECHTCIEVSICCQSPEHDWFPMLCKACGEFSDQICRYCYKIMYKLPSN